MISFKDANSALQESIGDSIFLAFMAPQHLHRLRLIPDSLLIDQTPPYNLQPNINDYYDKYITEDILTDVMIDAIGNPKIKADLKELLPNFNKAGTTVNTDLMKLKSIITQKYPNITNIIKKMPLYKKLHVATNPPSKPINTFDLSLLLRMALSKIPQISFEYILDVFRWDIFADKVPMESANKYFWQLLRKNQGIGAPDQLIREGGGLFDAGAKFHVADNTPFVR